MLNYSNNLMVIAGSVYQINRQDRSLMRLNGKGDTIREKQMRKLDNFHVIAFDAERMELVPIQHDEAVNDKLLRIQIPDSCFTPIVFPKPEETAYFNVQSKKFGWGVTFLSQHLIARILGILPTIDVAGIRYDLDIEGQILKTKSKSYPNLSMARMEFLPESGSMVFVYNRDKRCAVDMNENVAYSPQETFYVEMEDPASLDPVGMAKHLGLNEGAFILPEFNYRPLYHTTAIPLYKLLARLSCNQPFNGEYNDKLSKLSGAVYDDSYSFSATLKR